MTCANTHRRLKEVAHPLPGAGLQPPNTSVPISPRFLSPAITLPCSKKQAEYVTPVKAELLPSAAPSARDFFINGKDQSLKLLQRSFYSSAGMDGAVPSLPGSGSGRKTFP